MIADANYVELSTSFLEDPHVLMGKPVGVMGIYLAVEGQDFGNVRSILSSMREGLVDQGNFSIS